MLASEPQFTALQNGFVVTLALLERVILPDSKTYYQAAMVGTGAPPPWSYRWDCLGHTLTHILSPTPGASQFLGGVAVGGDGSHQASLSPDSAVDTGVSLGLGFRHPWVQTDSPRVWLCPPGPWCILLWNGLDPPWKIRGAVGRWEPCKYRHGHSNTNYNISDHKWGHS